MPVEGKTPTERDWRGFEQTEKKATKERETITSTYFRPFSGKRISEGNFPLDFRSQLEQEM